MVKVDAAVFGDVEVTEEGLCSKLRVLRDKKAWKPALVLAVMFVFQVSQYRSSIFHQSRIFKIFFLFKDHVWRRGCLLLQPGYHQAGGAR